MELATEKGFVDLIRKQTAANLWANERYVNWLKSVSEELLFKTIPSSFPSIEETLIHIWDVERYWLAIVQQTTLPESFRLNGFHGTLEDVFTGLIQKSNDFKTYVYSLDEEDLLEERKLDTPWVKGVQPQYDFILHAMNHSIYHRGQIVTIARNMGLDENIPMGDYNAYLMMPEG